MMSAPVLVLVLARLSLYLMAVGVRAGVGPFVDGVRVRVRAGVLRLVFGPFIVVFDGMFLV